MKSSKTLALTLLVSLITLGAFAQLSVIQYTETNGLPSNDVCGGIAVAPNGNIWAGTSAGVAKFNGTVWTGYDSGDGMISDYCTCIAVDNNNIVWVGTDMGLCRFDGSTFTNYTTVEGLADNSVNYIACDNAGKVYIATFNGVSVFNGISFDNLTTDDGLPTNLIVYVHVVAPNNVWFATLGEGAVYFNGTSFTSFSTGQGLASTDISSVVVDTDQKKWIASFSGIDVLDSENQYYTLQNHEDGLYSPYADGLYHDFVQDVAADALGNIWACVYVDYLQDGAVTLYSNGEWQTVFTETNSLRDIKTDPNGNAWIGSGAGVFKVQIESSLNEIDESLMPVVYPNPAEQYINILYADKICSVKIFNVQGKLVSSYSNEQSNRFDISGLADGYYYIQFDAANLRYTLNFVKK
ncbi:MAG: T9SS type A sorting domain-containing protein [Bacteroidales bacterium]|nr:T9SS type A sorting domain-containing protein [Bacteroidales bacterium]HOY39993.1 T9SS type A sorting domain-containing protein [Bacteroidales bacterium]HQP04986.1 T9SS type A sorting domain-containing protein [Bacteroidales bacterium]